LLAGFRLAEGSVLSPNAGVCSWSASRPSPPSKGARLGWLLLPAEQAVEIWHAGEAPPQRLAPATTLDAGELFPGLQINLAEIWQA